MNTHPTTGVEIQFRRLVPTDAASYWDIRFEAVSERPPAFITTPTEHSSIPIDSIRQRLSEPSIGFILGAFSAGYLVGVAEFWRNNRDRTAHKGRISGVYVKPQFRGKGIGRKIISEVLTIVQESGQIELVTLEVLHNQSAARSLYQSLAFEEYGREPKGVKVDREHIDLILMAIRLS